MMWYVIWYDMIWYDIRYCMIRYDMIWYDMIYDIWCDMIWYNTWCDMLYDMISYHSWQFSLSYLSLMSKYWCKPNILFPPSGSSWRVCVKLKVTGMCLNTSAGRIEIFAVCSFVQPCCTGCQVESSHAP